MYMLLGFLALRPLPSSGLPAKHLVDSAGTS
jgi:hypothetical protein